jgi:hypothetical protein
VGVAAEESNDHDTKAKSRSVKARSSALKSKTGPTPNSEQTRAKSIVESYRKRGFVVLEDDETAFVIGMSGPTAK